MQNRRLEETKYRCIKNTMWTEKKLQVSNDTEDPTEHQKMPNATPTLKLCQPSSTPMDNINISETQNCVNNDNC
jgi:hypothetical protein